MTAPSITHQLVASDPQTPLIGATDWNNTHTMTTVGSNVIIGAITAGGVQELTAAQVATIIGGGVGSDTQFIFNNAGSLAGASAFTYNTSTPAVNISTNTQLNFVTSSTSFAIFGTGVSMFYLSSNNHFFRSGTTGTTDLAHFSTQGLIINSPTPVASNSALWLQGSILTGGSGTTTFPTIFVQPTAATAVTTFPTTGTIFGSNQISGFTGNHAGFYTNGTVALTVGSAGQMFSNAAVVTSAGAAGTNGPTLAMVFAGYGLGANNNGELVAILNSTASARLGAGCTVSSNGAFGWSNTTNVGLSNAVDTFISRSAAATLHFGTADAASPVAQTLGVQGVVAGTTNTAGANFTIAGSIGTGTGTGGSIIFQTAAAGSTGSTQNALVTALTIDSTQLATFAGNILTGTAGKGLQIKSGSNARIGTGTLSGGTLAVANTSVTATTRVFLQDTNAGALTNVGSLTVVTSAGVGFTVTSTNVLDTSTFNYLLIEST